MGDIIQFPIDNGRHLRLMSEDVLRDASALERQSQQAVKAAEELLGDVVSVDFRSVEPDFDSPA